MRKYLKRILAMVLAVAMATPMTTEAAVSFASASLELEAKSGDKIAVSELLGEDYLNLPENNSTDNSVSVTLTWKNGTATIERNDIVGTFYHIVDPDDQSYNNLDGGEIVFEKSGEYKVYHGHGIYEASLSETAQNEFNAKVDAAEALDNQVSSLNTEAETLEATAEGLEATAEGLKATAEDLETTAQEALDALTSHEDYSAYTTAMKDAGNNPIEILGVAGKYPKCAGLDTAYKAAAATAASARDSADDAAQAASTARSNADSKSAEAEQKARDAASAWSAVEEYVGELQNNPEKHIIVGNVSSYDYSNEEYISTLKVDVYNELTVNLDKGNMTEVPTVSVDNANGGTSPISYKVYTTNKDVVITFSKIDNYNVKLTVGTEEIAVDKLIDNGTTYSYELANGIIADTVATVKYTEYGTSVVYYDIENSTGVKALKVIDENSNVITSGKSVYDETSVKATAEAEEGYKITGITVVSDETTVVTSSTAEVKFDVDSDTYSEYKIVATAESQMSTVNVVLDNVDAMSGAITATSGTVNGNMIKDILPEKNVEIIVPLKSNYKITKFELADSTATVDVQEDNGKFTFKSADVSTEYTLTITTMDTNNKVVLGTVDNNVKSIVVKDDGTTYDVEAGEQSIETGSTVQVTVETKENEGYELKDFSIVCSDNSVVSVTNEGNNVYSFTAKGEGVTYTVNVGTQDTRSNVVLGSAENVVVKVNGTTFSDRVTEIKVLNDSTVNVVVEPNENYYISEVKITDVTDSSNPSVVANAFDYSGNNATVSFEAEANRVYSIDTTAAKVLVAKDTTDKINIAYVIAMFDEENTSVTKESVEKMIWDAAFDAVSDDIDYSKGNVKIEYLAGTITIPALKLFGQEIIPETLIPVYSAIDEKTPTAVELKAWIKQNAGIDLDSDLIKRACSLAGINLDEIITNALASFHTFGDNPEIGDSITEEVRAVYNGSVAPFTKATEVNEIVIEDTRIETIVKAEDEIKVTYGCYDTDDTLKAALLAGEVNGVYYIDESRNEVKLGNEYQNKLELTFGSVATLVKADVGSYNAKVSFPNTDLEYKSSSKDVKITVEKASAVVNVTENNVVKYENINSVKWSDLVTVEPGSEVIIEDKVAHIPFVVGIDMLNGKATATLDVGSVLGVANDNLAASIKLNELVDTLAGLGISLGDETVTEIINALVEIEETLGVEVEVNLTAYADQNKLVPKSHGVYAVGAVTADPNYNTAANVTYFVVAAEPVGVEFVDANNNNARLFTFDGTAKEMEAFAYLLDDETKTPIDGTMSYRYAGVQSDGTAYYSSEAPYHTGTYTVVALYRDNAATPNKVGMAVGTMIIQPADAIVAVDNATHIYDGNEFDVNTLIKSTPADAKVAIITAGVVVEGGDITSTNGIVNIDLPERAERVFEQVFGRSLDSYEIDKEDFIQVANELKSALESAGIDASVIDEIISVINQVPDVIKLTFKDQADVNPSEIGVYFVGAVVFDPNYVPEAGAGILIITPEEVHVDFEPDLNIDNAREFVYDGEPKEMPVEVKYFGRDDEPTGTLTVTYVGVDSQGNEYNRTEAPTNVGVYSVIAIYEEKDAAGKLLAYGANVGLMAITPADVEVTVDIADIECTCGCDTKTCEATCATKADCGTGLNVLDKIKVDAVKAEELKKIAVTVDEEGNVNIILPEEWNVESSTTENTVDEVLAEIIAEIAKVESLAGSEAISEAIQTIIDELKALETEALDEEAQKVIDEVIAQLESINTATVKAAINTIIEEVKALGLTSEDGVNAVVALLESLKTETDDAQIAATIDTILSTLENVDTDQLDTTAKAALGAIVAMVKDLDITEIKEVAKTSIDAIIAELEAIDTSILSTEADKAIASIVAQLTALKAEVENAETDVESAASKLVQIFEEIETTVGKINSVSINGEQNYACGTYSVYALAFGPNHKAAVGSDEFTIYPPTAKDPSTPTDPDEEPKPGDSNKPGSGSSDGDDDSDSELEGVYHPSSSTPASTTGTSTGDSANILGYAALILAAGAALVILFLKKRRA